EIETPAFNDFLKKAAASFQDNLKRVQTKPADVMPWKLNGERWHLSEKGFPVGKSVRWDKSILKDMVELVREVVPGLEIDWSGQGHIALKVPGVSRSWAHWRTKESFGLDCRFLGKKSQFNLSQLEPFGVKPDLHDRRDGTVVRLIFQHRDHLQPAKLKAMLREQVAGFREAFGKEKVKK
ncbi:MAG: hypothetical protein AB7K24_13705, partial [Gemmataceae bacterium]